MWGRVGKRLCGEGGPPGRVRTRGPHTDGKTHGCARVHRRARCWCLKTHPNLLNFKPQNNVPVFSKLPTAGVGGGILPPVPLLPLDRTWKRSFRGGLPHRAGTWVRAAVWGCGRGRHTPRVSLPGRRKGLLTFLSAGELTSENEYSGGTGRGRGSSWVWTWTPAHPRPC